MTIKSCIEVTERIWEAENVFKECGSAFETLYVNDFKDKTCVFLVFVYDDTTKEAIDDALGCFAKIPKVKKIASLGIVSDNYSRKVFGIDYNANFFSGKIVNMPDDFEDMIYAAVELYLVCKDEETVSHIMMAATIPSIIEPKFFGTSSSLDF